MPNLSKQPGSGYWGTADDLVCVRAKPDKAKEHAEKKKKEKEDKVKKDKGRN